MQGVLSFIALMGIASSSPVYAHPRGMRVTEALAEGPLAGRAGIPVKATSGSLSSIRSTVQRDLNSTLISMNSTCSGNSAAAPTNYFMDDMDHTGSGRGIAPHVSDNSYKVYEKVSPGSGDDSTAIQKAIDDGDRSGVTKMPRQVYLAPGTYNIGQTINLKMGTIIVGNPLNPPVLKASSGFSGQTLINGYDSATGHAEDSFFTLLKNVKLDTTAVSSSQSFTALQWGVAQACGLSNVAINMPMKSSHTGINLKGGSTIAVADVSITGGKVGISNSNQQVNFKNISFKGCTTGYKATGGWTALLQSPTFDGCGVGADITSGGSANIAIVDASSINNSGPVIKFNDDSSSSSKNNQVVIENLTHEGTSAIAVKSDNSVALASQSTVDSWIWGTQIGGKFAKGVSSKTQRPQSLLVGGKYLTTPEPTFSHAGSDTFVNVKAYPGFTVHGDGKTDDSAALNSILAHAAASCKNVYFPYGVYIVQDTLVIPPNTRMIGEAWPVISGAGAKFKDATKPVPVVQVGLPGQIGVAQISDMRFTVSEVLPGAIITQFNMAGNPGDVGMWNTHVTIGGTADSKVTTSCSNQDTKNCMAAFMGIHLAPTSSAYVENSWIWTADHAFDGVGGVQNIATGRGVVVQSTKATWLMGIGSEHHWLANVNMANASNVYAGLIQTETPYMQGDGAVETVPAPWTVNAAFGDPNYSWCAAGDQKCRTSLATNIDGGSNIYLYNSANWAFFNGPWSGSYSNPCSGTCQTNMNRVNNVKNLAWHSVSTKSADNVILDTNSQDTITQSKFAGSWGGLVDLFIQS